MRYRAVVLSLCGVLTAGVTAAPPAAADVVSCVDQLVADLQAAPVPDPTTIVVINGLDIDVDTTQTTAFTTAVRNAALAFANCAVPDPNAVVACATAVTRAIITDIGHQADDEVYLRYVHLHPDGLSINGEYLAGDVLALAACV